MCDNALYNTPVRYRVAKLSTDFATYESEETVNQIREACRISYVHLN